MANTLISYNGKNAYYNNDNTRAPFLSTSATGQIYLNSNCYQMFASCESLINFNFISELNFDYVENADSMFLRARNFNENFVGGKNITDANYMFCDCNNLRKTIDLSPCSNMKYATGMFMNCRSLNIPPILSDSIEEGTQMFFGCNNFNENIALPANLLNADSMFGNCVNLNQNIKIPQGTISTITMFHNCVNLNQNIKIPNSIENTRAMFANCFNLNQSITLPASIKDAAFMFRNCGNIHDIYININTSQKTHNFVNLVLVRNTSSRLNIWCNNLYYLNRSTATTGIVGANITWTAITNGYRNTFYNIYLYKNYTGNT